LDPAAAPKLGLTPAMPIPALDPFSFWLGFVVAALLAAGAYRYRQRMAGARSRLVRSLSAGRDFFASGTERLVREDTLRFAQTSHLAGSLFALEDIRLPPRLLPFPTLYDPTAPPPDPDVNSVIPVLPEWPDLAAIYRVPGLTPAEALSGGSNLLVIGGPGAGKTTLLAHLATRVALEDLTLFGQTSTPVFVHVADLGLPLAPGADVDQPLIAAAQARASALTSPRLPRHLRQRLREGRCVILLDGFDDLGPEALAEAAGWLAQFQIEHKQHRLVAAAGLTGYGPLLQLGLAPVLIAPFGREDFHALIRKWGSAWDKLVRASRRRGAADTNTLLIMNWLGNGNQGRTIFEVTLKIWAAFAGDARGKRPVDWLEAYVLRHGVKANGQQALGRLAALLLDREGSSPVTWAEAVTMLDALLPGPSGRIDGEDFLADMTARHLLARHRDRVCFQHPLAAAYCAARAAADEPAAVAPGQSAGWMGALYFYASLGELTPLVAQHLSLAPDLLHSDLLTTARWVRDAPANARWRTEVFRRLTRLLIDPEQPFDLRQNVLGAFVAANDASIVALFRQGLAADDDPLLRWMATLGLGSLGEGSATVSIASHFTDTRREVRWSAALALSALNNETATQSLGQGLLVGDDDLRRACAEALARLPEDGHAMLREAIGHADVSVRRAGVYGLAATREDWARAILQQVQHTEQQWFVRSAIQDMLAQWVDTSARAPKPYSPPDATGWLIAWAAQQGLGVPRGQGALEVLFRALAEGDDNTRRAAADFLGGMGEPESARSLYPLLKEKNPVLRDAAFRALAHLAAGSGQRLAAPA
jgi:HEAT repeat protein